MSRRDRLRHLKHVAEHKREAEEIVQVFMNSIARLKAQVDDTPSPPPHPRSHDEHYKGTLFEVEQIIVGGGVIEDLYE